MIRFLPNVFSQKDWCDVVARFGDVSLPQCWAYGEARAADGGWRLERGVIEQNGRLVGAAQVMIRRLPIVGGGLAWISRGPLRRVRDASNSETLADLLGALRRHYVGERGLYLRIAPPVAKDEPEPVEPAIAAAGFRTCSTGGWASATLDLRRELEELRAGLGQKWRNGLNKAERLGVRVERARDAAGFAAFLDEYRRFLAKRAFSTTITPPLLERLQRLLPDNRKLVVYRAWHGGSSLGSVLIARYADTAEYLASASLDAGRPFNAGQILLWHAIADMKAEGFARFDVGGMDPILTPKGIFDFKNGLGGVPYCLIGEIEADDRGWRAWLVRRRVDRARNLARESSS